MTDQPTRFLSGIQPSGRLHLGNYFGAIREHIALQSEGDALYFIANYHALTSLRDADQLREYSRDVAVSYLACGLDPDQAAIFLQSDVPEVCELTWLLMTMTPMGLLQRAVSYKDKVDRGISADAGLFTYPVLMAADILAYDSNVVPVGKDQVQHVEMTRDLAQAFNNTYGDVFVVPNYRLGVAPYVSGTDGAKMSKSYGNTIEIFETGKPLKKKVMAITTDSTPVEEPKDPETCTVFSLYSLIAEQADIDALAERYRAGGMGYGEAKKLLLEAIETKFAPIRERREHFVNNPDLVDKILRDGAEKARPLARATLDRARKACGVG